MVVTMQTRLSQQAMRQGKFLESELFNDSYSLDLYEQDRKYRSVNSDIISKPYLYCVDLYSVIE